MGCEIALPLLISCTISTEDGESNRLVLFPTEVEDVSKDVGVGGCLVGLFAARVFRGVKAVAVGFLDEAGRERVINQLLCVSRCRCQRINGGEAREGPTTFNFLPQAGRLAQATERHLQGSYQSIVARVTTPSHSSRSLNCGSSQVLTTLRLNIYSM